MNRSLNCLFALIFVMMGRSAFAWNETGHRVIGQIAWSRMTPQARAAAITLLTAAPADSDVLLLKPEGRLTADAFGSAFLGSASTWSDMVRSGSKPERREKYNHPTWHYSDTYWQTDANGKIQTVSELKPDAENAIERLKTLSVSLKDIRRPSEERTIDLLWILHLAGDIHQPLHTSSRVTAEDPKGDMGGNAFRLSSETGRRENLHSYWDGILDRAYPKNAGEPEDVYLNRIVTDLLQRYPPARAGRIKSGNFEQWAAEGVHFSQSTVYKNVERNGVPGAAYEKNAEAIGEKAVTLAGYRLADLLNHLLANG